MIAWNIQPHHFDAARSSFVTKKLFHVVPVFFVMLAFFSCSDNTKTEQEQDQNSVKEEEEVQQPIKITIPSQPIRGAATTPIVETNLPVAVPTDLPPNPGPLGPPLPIVPVIPPVIEECLPEFCGDGIEQEGEDCDDGNDDNDDECDNYCRTPRCGNGTVEGNEECDNPDHAGCTDDCRLPLCGNNDVDEGETCDPPNNTSCNANCTTSVCGNGIVEVGEECDDDNEVDGDGCSNTCTLSCIAPQV